jgi:hypothetical protein
MVVRFQDLDDGLFCGETNREALGRSLEVRRTLIEFTFAVQPCAVPVTKSRQGLFDLADRLHIDASDQPHGRSNGPGRRGRPRATVGITNGDCVLVIVFTTWTLALEG